MYVRNSIHVSTGRTVRQDCVHVRGWYSLCMGLGCCPSNRRVTNELSGLIYCSISTLSLSKGMKVAWFTVLTQGGLTVAETRPFPQVSKNGLDIHRGVKWAPNGNITQGHQRALFTCLHYQMPQICSALSRMYRCIHPLGGKRGG